MSRQLSSKRVWKRSSVSVTLNDFILDSRTHERLQKDLTVIDLGVALVSVEGWEVYLAYAMEVSAPVSRCDRHNGAALTI
jgi:hypothetical protein